MKSITRPYDVWMLAEGLWSRHGRGSLRELVQLDGSFHDWLEGRGPRACLRGPRGDMVDDATSETQVGLGTEETIWAAAGVLRAWIEKYGVPRALYTDWKSVSKRKATPAEQLRREVPVVQERAVQDIARTCILTKLVREHQNCLPRYQLGELIGFFVQETYTTY